jgi:hypothetical protein
LNGSRGESTKKVAETRAVQQGEPNAVILDDTWRLAPFGARKKAMADDVMPPPWKRGAAPQRTKEKQASKGEKNQRPLGPLKP